MVLKRMNTKLAAPFLSFLLTSSHALAYDLDNPPIYDLDSTNNSTKVFLWDKYNQEGKGHTYTFSQFDYENWVLYITDKLYRRVSSVEFCNYTENDNLYTIKLYENYNFGGSSFKFTLKVRKNKCEVTNLGAFNNRAASFKFTRKELPTPY